MNLSAALGVMAVWDGAGTTVIGLSYADPRLPALGCRTMLPPHLAADAAADLGARLSTPATMTRTASRSACRAAARISATATPSRTKPTWTSSPASISPKGCYVGQEVVSRMEHRGIARTPRRAGAL